jgi:signal transduction histidine kinase
MLESSLAILWPVKRAFVPANQVARNYGGTRLGLAICARLVWMMGEKIWVETAS